MLSALYTQHLAHLWHLKLFETVNVSDSELGRIASQKLENILIRNCYSKHIYPAGAQAQVPATFTPNYSFQFRELS